MARFSRVRWSAEPESQRYVLDSHPIGTFTNRIPKTETVKQKPT
jgi:hypothetical protein